MPNMNNWIIPKHLRTANKGLIDFAERSLHPVGRYSIYHRLYDTARSVPYSVTATDSLRISGEIRVLVHIKCGDQLLVA